jgi:dipeptidase E
MKLLLNSSYLTNDKLRNTLLKMLSKPIKENKVLIIHQKHYAKKTYPEYSDLVDSMLPRDTKIFTELGILPENISSYDAKTEEKPDINSIDILYAQGGNTYYYLQQIRKNGYWDDIRDFIEGDGVYLGNSAGSMMMCPDVDEDLYILEKNHVGVKDVTGFGFVPFYIVAHWDSKSDEVREKMLKYGEKSRKQVIPLTDEQGVLVTENEYKVI